MIRYELDDYGSHLDSLNYYSSRWKGRVQPIKLMVVGSIKLKVAGDAVQNPQKQKEWRSFRPRQGGG